MYYACVLILILENHKLLNVLNLDIDVDVQGY